MDLKDLPNLYGVDIVRGKGVCRSISSMLVDIYKDLGYNATNLVVCATEDSIKNQQQLCDFPKKKSTNSKEQYLNLNRQQRSPTEFREEKDHRPFR